MDWSKVFGAITSILSVTRTLLNESAIDPQTKADLHATLTDAHTTVTTAQQNVGGLAQDAATLFKDAPGFAGGLAGAAAGTAAAAIPGVGAALAPEAEGIVNSVVTGILNNFEDIFTRHNKAHIAAIGQLLGSPPQAVANAVTTVEAANQSTNA